MADQGFLNQIARYFKRMGMVRKFIICASLLLGMLLFSAGPTTIRVLDAETKEPIEGAVALAMWKRTKGLPGLYSTYTAKAVEAVSDADGFLRIPMRFGFFALQTPHLKIYKPLPVTIAPPPPIVSNQGVPQVGMAMQPSWMGQPPQDTDYLPPTRYVVWDSRLIYLGPLNNPKLPRLKKRDHFSMKSQDIYLEPWRDEYTFISHGTLLNMGILGIHEAGIKESKYRKAADHERLLQFQEGRKFY